MSATDPSDDRKQSDHHEQSDHREQEVTKALVFGAGAVGAAVVRELTAKGITCSFTYAHRRDHALALAEATGATAHHVDADDPSALGALAAAHADVDAVIHCAAVLETASLEQLTLDAFDRSHVVNARSAFVLCQAFGRTMAERGRGGIWFVGGMDRAQSLPVPIAYAATQGTLAAMTMAVAKELGPKGVRVNMIALGLLDEGLSLALDPSLRADFLSYSALRRFGTPAEAARAITWLARNSRYLNGKVIPINGGL